ncbi:MAG TPA: hypothetical protein VGW78_06555 [Candidatus Babeliales bacterium]|jgi:hypothetical protein|nr:hypothetical protein [Candidatus Babeliales bacterium]
MQKYIFSLTLNCLVLSIISNASESPGEILAKYKEIAEKRKSIEYKRLLLKGLLAGLGGGAYSYALSTFLPIHELRNQYIAFGAVFSALSIFSAEVITEILSSSSPEWVAQIRKLEKAMRDGLIYKERSAEIGGVPQEIQNTNRDKYNIMKDVDGKTYFFANSFHDIDRFETQHYEIYLMPKDKELVDVFLSLITGGSSISAYWGDIAFIVIRPTPGVSTSVYNGKYLPRIIIGLRPFVYRRDVYNFVEVLKKLLSKYEGIGYHPRYSEEIPGTNKLIYAAYGSGDYKDTQAGQEKYKSMKSKSWWRFISRDIEDMAYKNEDQRVSKTPWGLSK